MSKKTDHVHFAAVAIDVVVFGLKDNRLHVLLAPVDRPPHYTNIDACIGGLIGVDETADDAVKRHLKDKAKLTRVYFEQLYTFSALKRDKRNRVISVSYIGLVRPEVIDTYEHESAFWVPVDEVRKLAYDHNEILEVALKRLQGKLEYTTVVQYLLPKEFTLSELQEVYEAVLKTSFDKRNFRKKILSLDILKDLKKMQEGVPNRPAALYSFKKEGVVELSVFV